MTFPFYLDLCRYWDEVCPPLDIMLAVKIGWKSKASKAKHDDLSELLGMFGNAKDGGGVIK